MAESIESLQQRKRSLFRKLMETGNFRRGTISVNYRKCGKKNCACAKQGHPGHGPRYLWSTTIKGKSYTKQLKIGPQLQKYVEDNDNYRSFKRLCEDIVQASEKLCDLMPAPEVKDAAELEELKKNLRRLLRKKYKKKSTA